MAKAKGSIYNKNRKGRRREKGALGDAFLAIFLTGVLVIPAFSMVVAPMAMAEAEVELKFGFVDKELEDAGDQGEEINVTFEFQNPYGTAVVFELTNVKDQWNASFEEIEGEGKDVRTLNVSASKFSSTYNDTYRDEIFIKISPNATAGNTYTILVNAIELKDSTGAQGSKDQLKINITVNKYAVTITSDDPDKLIVATMKEDNTEEIASSTEAVFTFNVTNTGNADGVFNIKAEKKQIWLTLTANITDKSTNVTVPAPINVTEGFEVTLPVGGWFLLNVNASLTVALELPAYAEMWLNATKVGVENGDSQADSKEILKFSKLFSVLVVEEGQDTLEITGLKTDKGEVFPGKKLTITGNLTNTLPNMTVATDDYTDDYTKDDYTIEAFITVEIDGNQREVVKIGSTTLKDIEGNNTTSFSVDCLIPANTPADDYNITIKARGRWLSGEATMTEAIKVRTLPEIGDAQNVAEANKIIPFGGNGEYDARFNITLLDDLELSDIYMVKARFANKTEFEEADIFVSNGNITEKAEYNETTKTITFYIRDIKPPTNVILTVQAWLKAGEVAKLELVVTAVLDENPILDADGKRIEKKYSIELWVPSTGDIDTRVKQYLDENLMDKFMDLLKKDSNEALRALFENANPENITKVAAIVLGNFTEKEINKLIDLTWEHINEDNLTATGRENAEKFIKALETERGESIGTAALVVAIVGLAILGIVVLFSYRDLNHKVNWLRRRQKSREK
jgi:hypothetical protein